MRKENKNGSWVTEVHQGVSGLTFKIDKILFSGKSEFQKVEVVSTQGHGNMLLNDGLIMLSERDEFIYHEMIAHVPMFCHPNPKKILIIGGGDGGTAREVLRHDCAEKVVMVEIDEMVVDACKKHFPSVSCALDDPRRELLIGDGVKYVASTDEIFDIVIIDSTDPIGPAEPLFSDDFYEDVSKILSTSGILITQAESPFYDAPVQVSMLSSQKNFFKRLHVYLFTNLTYPGGAWSFGFASNNLCPIKNFDQTRFEKSKLKTKYYNPGVHFASFMLPEFMKNNLEGIIDTFEQWDGAKLYV